MVCDSANQLFICLKDFILRFAQVDNRFNHCAVVDGTSSSIIGGDGQDTVDLSGLTEGCSRGLKGRNRINNS